MKGGAEGWEAGTYRHHIQGFIAINIHLIITKILASFLRQGTHCQPLIVFLPNKPRFLLIFFLLIILHAKNLQKKIVRRRSSKDGWVWPRGRL